jgi:dTDP-4-dehydrorhamnose reductase
MKKILITGSNGLLGQKLVYALLNDKNVELVATSKGPNRLINQQGYVYKDFDITDKKQVESVFGKYLPDVVINTAAMTNVDACETEKKACWAINVTAVQHMVDVLQELKAKTVYSQPYSPHFIHLSTDFVFDGEEGPYKETDKPNPLSYYALSKFESEKVLEQSNLKWAILRTIIVYGIVDNMSRTNVVLWAKDALSKGQKINVVDDQFRAPTLAEDLAEACILAANKKATGIFHTSGKDIMSVLELVNSVADFFKLDKSLINPIKSNTLNQAAKRPPRTGFILDKAINELGYKPHSFKEGLAILSSQLLKREFS